MKQIPLIIMLLLLIVILVCVFGRKKGQSYKGRIDEIYNHIHGLCVPQE